MQLVLIVFVLAIAAVTAVPVAPTLVDLDSIRPEQEQLIKSADEPESIRAARSLILGVGGVLPYAYPSKYSMLLG